MTKGIREVLSPLLIISYICGLRLIKFPVGDPRQWFSFVYILLLLALYNFIIIYTVSYTVNYSIEYHVCFGLHMFTTLTSIVIGIYYDKKFRSCIKKLTIVDDTLEKLETTTNHYKFKLKIVWFTLGWSVIIILLTCLENYILNDHMDILPTIFIPIMRNYCVYINFIGDLIIAIILGYTELKFGQINEYLKKSEGNKSRVKRTWKHTSHMLRLYKSRFPKALRNKCNKIWVVMHLHSELRKISRKIDSIFGTQMTLEMGCYFAYITMTSREIFHIINNKTYINNQMFYIIIILSWLFIYIFRLFLINYVCERVSTKANSTGDLINKFSYSTCNIEIRENILQFLLQITQSPVKFYGLGLFQFGFKYLYGFFASVLTVLVIYTQAYEQ